jgi:hypothetical protein
MLPSVRLLLVPELLLVRPVSEREVGACAIRTRIHFGDWLHVPARRRSRVRDELRFWSTVTSFVTSVVVLVVLVKR